MAEQTWQEEVAQRVLPLQLVVGGLLVGCLTFMGVAIGLVQLGEFSGQGNDAKIITWVALGVAFVAVGARVVVPAMIAARNRQALIRGTAFLDDSWARNPNMAEFVRRTGDAGRLWVGFFTRTILAAAILEGAAMLCVIAYLVEQAPISLLLATGLLVALAFHFPTRSGAVHWIEHQLNLVDQERQLQG